MWSLPSFFITVNYEHYHPVCGKTKVFKWLQITQHDIYALLSKSGSAVSLAAIFGSRHLSELVKYESVWSLLQFKVGNLCEGHSNMFVEQLLLYFVFQKSCCLIQCCAQCEYSEVLHSSVLVVTLHYTCRWTLGHTLYLERKLQQWCCILCSNVNALCLSAPGLALQHA